MTTNYCEFIGKEPSLNELNNFITNNKELYEGIDIDVIPRYLEFANKYGGHYYIGGQIKTFTDDRIITPNGKKIGTLCVLIISFCRRLIIKE